MTKEHRRVWRLVGLWMVVTAACNSHQVAEVRRHTYGQQFRYYDEQELRGVMGRMATIVIRLHELLGTDGQASDGQQAQVVQLLSDLEATAGELKTAETASNHQVIVDNLGRFLDDVRLARRQASAQPPNYFLAGSITGSCFHCHSRAR